MTTSSSRAARRGAARRVPAPAPAGRPQKPSKYTGVRLRQWGRWVAEVRVPGTRQKLWMGTFETDRQAALAYDAAVFCFYGVHLPSVGLIKLVHVPVGLAGEAKSTGGGRNQV